MHNVALLGLLRHPLELKLQIYGYLLPDIPIIPAVKHEPRTEEPNNRPVTIPIGPSSERRSYRYPRAIALRHDRRACHMAITRTNKQIHLEAKGMLYNSATLEIEVSRYSIVTLRGERALHLHDDHMASCFQRLEDTVNMFRKVYITLLPAPKPKKTDDAFDQTRQLKDNLNWIADLIASAKTKQLTISYRGPQWSMSCVEERMYWHLRAFQNIRGLEKAEIIHMPVLPVKVDATRSWIELLGEHDVESDKDEPDDVRRRREEGSNGCGAKEKHGDRSARIDQFMGELA